MAIHVKSALYKINKIINFANEGVLVIYTEVHKKPLVLAMDFEQRDVNGTFFLKLPRENKTGSIDRGKPHNETREVSCSPSYGEVPLICGFY